MSGDWQKRHQLRDFDQPEEVDVKIDCHAEANFRTEAQAEYVANGLTGEFGTVFQAVPHDDHFHVFDSGVPVPPPEPPDDHVVCAI